MSLEHRLTDGGENDAENKRKRAKSIEHWTRGLIHPSFAEETFEGALPKLSLDHVSAIEQEGNQDLFPIFEFYTRCRRLGRLHEKAAGG